jgi:ribose transport system ATP-binding protein
LNDHQIENRSLFIPIFIMTQPFLVLKNITKRFPGVTALRAVNLSIERGEVHILLGENGAGKSSLIKLLAGIYQPDEGEILLDGRPYLPRMPVDAFRAGIRVVHQELNLLPALSVGENLLFESLPARGGVVQYGAIWKQAQALLDEIGLDVSPRTRVEQLGIAQMQLLEIAKALYHESKLLILDEPTATLTPFEIERLFTIIRRLRDQGVTIIYISHRLHEIYEIGDRMTVLRNGEHIATRAVQDVTLNEIVSLMVGRETVQEDRFPADLTPGELFFEVRDLRRTPQSQPISFTVRRREVLGIAGLVGSGRTETMRAIFGADRKAGGEIYIDGKQVHIRNPRDAVRHGLSLVTEDRKTQGLMLDLPLTANTTITDLTKVSRGGVVQRPAEAREAARFIHDLRVKASGTAQHARYLSGGNQQKVVIAKWLFRGSNILIFDEPTRGIDVGARQEIYDLLWRLAGEGNAIIMVSSDLAELMEVCHRIIVFSKGVIAGEVERTQFDQEHILSLAYREHIRP